MTTVSDIFKARAESFGETMTGGSGIVSFKIPEYQRPYDWDEDNVLRLLKDCLNGLKGAASQAAGHPFTFLGTVIVTDDSNEPTFNGTSLSIVDGQQRLTTLLLLSAALFSAIRDHESDMEVLSDARTKKWLRSEVNEQTIRLYRCTTGQLQSLSPTTPYPRMVRTGDVRGHSFEQAQYLSVIGAFLHQFIEYCQGRNNSFPLVPMDNNQSDRLLQVYKIIREQIEQCVYLGQESLDGHDDGFASLVLTTEEFTRRGCRELFVKLRDVGDEPDANRVVSYIAGTPESAGLIRLLLFSSYIIRSVVLIVVHAPTEDIAFDIFDALNTTGEPLTALETLKPHVVRFERDRGTGFAGSPSERWWNTLEENVIDPNPSPELQQRATKELVTGFALYYIGHQIGSDLKEQRNTLRNYFVQARNRGDEVARGFTKSLSELAQYRRQYWGRESIDGVVGPLTQQDDYDALKLCLRFISATNTSTTIPILARYYIEYEEMDFERHFLDAVQAVSGFLVLRRAMTGGTARIDSDFRSIMSPVRGEADLPFSIGLSMSNRILSIAELKERLRALLAQNPFNIADGGVEGKAAWLSRAREIPLANQASRVVCKFILLAAAHNARPDQTNPGLLTREGIIPSDEMDYLNYRTFSGQKYATLEHVAPDSPTINGWDLNIYEQLVTRHTIGNLVLLPERENQSIGNSPWERKKLFYRALVAETEDERSQAIALAQEQGLSFGNKTISLLTSQDRLHMLDSVAEVDDWTAQVIKNRTENLLGLAWDRISPWLFDH